MGWEQDVNGPGRLSKRLSSSRHKDVVTSLHGQCEPNHIRKKELTEIFLITILFFLSVLFSLKSVTMHSLLISIQMICKVFREYYYQSVRSLVYILNFQYC